MLTHEVVGYGPELESVKILEYTAIGVELESTHEEVFETLFYFSFTGTSLIEFQ